MRCREIEANAGGAFDVLIPMEFGAIIGGNGFDVVTESVNERNHAPAQGFFGSIPELDDAMKAQMTGDLLWTPSLPQVMMNNREVAGIELGIAPRDSTHL